MLKLQMFSVYHDGYWIGLTPSDPPTFFLVIPSQSDSRELARLKIKELGLTTRRPDMWGCYGIPDKEYCYASTYLKTEISNFLAAIGFSPASYDFNSIGFFTPKP